MHQKNHWHQMYCPHTMYMKNYCCYHLLLSHHQLLDAPNTKVPAPAISNLSLTVISPLAVDVKSPETVTVAGAIISVSSAPNINC